MSQHTEISLDALDEIADDAEMQTTPEIKLSKDEKYKEMKAEQVQKGKVPYKLLEKKVQTVRVPIIWFKNITDNTTSGFSSFAIEAIKEKMEKDGLETGLL